MAAYLIAHVDVTDPQLYEKYRLKVPSVVAAYRIALRQRCARSTLHAFESA